MRILLAEPNRADRATVTALLAEDGHEVVGCADAQAALQMIRAEAGFDVLITATEFSSMSGFELCWEARLIASQGQPLYVIVLSSSRDEQKLVESLDCGADDFINKPPRKSEFLARLRAAGRLLSAHRELIRLASFDSLTDLRNRRSFFEELENCANSSAVHSVIMLDLDHFKGVNDTHGHEAGDDVLRELGRRASAIDKGFARLGGEEFALLVKGPLAAAGEKAEAIRRAVISKPFLTAAGPLAITASLGVAEREPGADFDKALKQADIALYASKSAGRNRVTLAHQGQEGIALPVDTVSHGVRSHRRSPRMEARAAG